jgi:integrase
MATLTITRRKVASGTRFVVRYRLGGRGWPVEHGGTFKTQKEARIRRDVIAGELAAGRNPKEALRAMLEQPAERLTLRQWATRYEASRVDIADDTKRNLGSHLKPILKTLGDRDPDTLSHADVQEWIAGLELKPGSVRRYVATFRGLLDYAGVDPNPARDPRVRLPREETAIVDPPTAADVDTIIALVPKRHRLPLRILEQTGMRIGELQALTWGDVDEARSKVRIKAGKTAAARRWVAVPEWLMEEVAATCPREDRSAERKLFIGFSPSTVKAAMARACIAAGIPHRHPHDLRHRYASIQIANGVPVTAVAAQLGHSKKSLTLDTYSHVVLQDDQTP